MRGLDLPDTVAERLRQLSHRVRIDRSRKRVNAEPESGQLRGVTSGAEEAGNLPLIATFEWGILQSKMSHSIGGSVYVA